MSGKNNLKCSNLLRTSTPPLDVLHLLKRLRVHGYLLQKLLKDQDQFDTLDEATKEYDKRRFKRAVIYLAQQKNEETRCSSWHHLQGMPKEGIDSVTMEAQKAKDSIAPQNENDI